MSDNRITGPWDKPMDEWNADDVSRAIDMETANAATYTADDYDAWWRALTEIAFANFEDGPTPDYIREHACRALKMEPFPECKDDTPKPDPRDPDYSRTGIFVQHNCWKCDDGKKPCVAGNPRQCEFPHARND